jgi:hypothetical protein
MPAQKKHWVGQSQPDKRFVQLKSRDGLHPNIQQEHTTNGAWRLLQMRQMAKPIPMPSDLVVKNGAQSVVTA